MGNSNTKGLFQKPIMRFTLDIYVVIIHTGYPVYRRLDLIYYTSDVFVKSKKTIRLAPPTPQTGIFAYVFLSIFTFILLEYYGKPCVDLFFHSGTFIFPSA